MIRQTPVLIAGRSKFSCSLAYTQPGAPTMFANHGEANRRNRLGQLRRAGQR